MTLSYSIEAVYGSGNVFRNLELPDADILQLKPRLAVVIIKALDRDGLSVRAAEARTGLPADDFSRIRHTKLERFSSDRLMSILNRLGVRLDVEVKAVAVDARKPKPVHADLRRRMPRLKTSSEALVSVERDQRLKGN